ncbi:hypothetical protein LWI29_010615 [Acer saccharum]|uniref:Uncharacterized protein n=1 Tax=Acer saccharum TaxID=4024 RepID=A0AA39RQJ2_ACESA|nr:hypothetical protein LWI29_010615 [Acer saccharum]
MSQIEQLQAENLFYRGDSSLPFDELQILKHKVSLLEASNAELQRKLQECRVACEHLIQRALDAQIEIRRTIPKGLGLSKDFKTKKIFVGGIPPSVSEGLCSNKSSFCSFDDVLNVSRGVKSQCQGNDSLAYIDGNGRNVELFGGSGDESSRGGSADGAESIDLGEEETEEKDVDAPSLDELRELLLMGSKELEVARLNSTMFEEKAQRISEAAITLKDEAANVWNLVNTTLEEIVNEECVAKEAVQKATTALSSAEARLQVALESLQVVIGEDDTTQSSGESDTESADKEDDGVLLAAESNIRECKAYLENCEAELRRL